MFVLREDSIIRLDVVSVRNEKFTQSIYSQTWNPNIFISDQSCNLQNLSARISIINTTANEANINEKNHENQQ